MKIGALDLQHPKQIWNIDSTQNKSGMITKFADLQVRCGDKMLRSVGRSVRLGRWGVCPECRQGVERICRAISKQVQRSDARIEVDVMHTWNECTE
jgi:hypothetical protein